MTPERWKQIDELLEAALEREGSEQADLLAKASGSDEELRCAVESLLASHRQAETFIETPASNLAAKLLSDSQSLPLIGRILGHYQILALLGAGGMGEVYRAHDSRLGREVAIKILPEYFSHNRQVLARFEYEAKVLGALSHPNILTIHDFATEQGIAFAVMELLEGETLRALLSRSVLPWRKTIEIAIGIADGLAAAHLKGIVHLDLKPENIFLTSDGQLKILDFGLARLKLPPSKDAKSTATKSDGTPAPGLLRGTPGYMSPEQLSGEAPRASSDIFSFGCVLYEMATGKPPFARETVADTLAASVRDEPPSLAHSPRPVPADLKRVMQRCIEKKPEARFQSGQELIAELRAFPNHRGPSKSLLSVAAHRVRPAVWLGVFLILLIAVSAALYRNLRGHTVSLLVLPVVDEPERSQGQLLSREITEGVINRLSQVPNLRVLAYTTSWRFKDKNNDPQTVGRNLGVANVVTIRTQPRDDDVVVQVALVNVAGGTQLWGERYSRKLADVLSIQREVAERILERLRLNLTSDERRRVTKAYTANAQAYDSYFRGRYFWNQRTKRGLDKAIEYFKEAIEIDPTYALAYAGLADSYSVSASYRYLPANEAQPLAERYALKALSLDDTLAEAHTAFGRLEADRGDELAAEKEFSRAIELSPNYATAHHWYSNLLGRLGRPDEQLTEIKRAQQLDPASPDINTELGHVLYMMRRYGGAIAQLQRTIEMDPVFVQARLEIIASYEQMGMYGEALLEMQHLLNLTGNDVAYKMELGHWYAMSGKRSEAFEMAEELEDLRTHSDEKVSAAGIAVIYAALDEENKAFEWLARAYLEEGSLVWSAVDPRFDNLRSDTRFSDLVQRVKRKR